MALTSKEKQKRYREKKKQNSEEYAQLKARQKHYSVKYRAKKNMPVKWTKKYTSHITRQGNVWRGTGLKKACEVAMVQARRSPFSSPQEPQNAKYHFATDTCSPKSLCGLCEACFIRHKEKERTTSNTEPRHSDYY